MKRITLNLYFLLFLCCCVYMTVYINNNNTCIRVLNIFLQTNNSFFIYIKFIQIIKKQKKNNYKLFRKKKLQLQWKCIIYVCFVLCISIHIYCLYNILIHTYILAQLYRTHHRQIVYFISYFLLLLFKSTPFTTIHIHTRCIHICIIMYLYLTVEFA